MKLMVAVPTMFFVNVNFAQSMADLCIKLTRDGVKVDVQFMEGSMIYVSRDRLAYRAIEGEYTHVLWLDSDMSFKPHIVDDLLWCGKDMVCGAFVSRKPPFSPCVYASIEDPANMEKVKDFGKEPFRVDGCGMACVLTSVELLKAVFDRFDTCFMPTEKIRGEDIAFCDRVKQLGYEIWCEPTVKPGHTAHIDVYAGGEKA
jgi:hypothetical protein